VNDLPRFDRWAFDNQRPHAASQESSLDFTDLRSIHVENHATPRTRRWVPSFASSDQSLRLVLAWRAWRYVYSGTHKTLPRKFLTDYTALDKLATAKLKRCERRACHMPGAHFRAVHRCGSYLSLQAAIAYRSWRLGWDSPTIAQGLGVSPAMVRTTLSRLQATAELLGLPINVSHPSKGKARIKINSCELSINV